MTMSRNHCLLQRYRSPRDMHDMSLVIPAGRMVLENGIVHPLLGRGNLCMVRERMKDKLYLAWFNHDGNECESFRGKPGTITVNWVEKCKTGRVVLFTIKDSNKLLFYWLQSKSTDDDVALMNEMKRLIRRTIIILPPSEIRREMQRNNPKNIQMPTLRRILAEVTAKESTVEVDLVEIFTSSKLAEELEENREFYMSRMKRNVTASVVEADDLLDPLKFVQDSRVHWTAVMIDNLLRDESLYELLCCLFPPDFPATKPGVTNFLMNLHRLDSRRRK
ncbi:uncharacterized protein TM35_000044720 [Trypanosoma theileri]|uniref:Pru domain-containing protein n=1 Tax=Trypanosoma theileri TaxID=67003 RepID=A0A1X0P5X9_9TRYP|nr:uncharacterized protein TM35_000044720 [Trypanosoma theileri]ORC92258.1 hypothetical protein TM35_000044720 [Trypanosoma theileri]